MPSIGDQCKADPYEEGQFLFGVITKIEGDIAYSDLAVGFGGDVPTRKHNGVWIFDAF